MYGNRSQSVRTQRPRWFRHLAYGLLLVGTSVLAQGGKPDAEVKFRKGSQLSTHEMIAQSDSYLLKMRGTLDRVSKLAERARKEKDIIKLNCVNDKLIQVKGHLNLAEQARLALSAPGTDEDTRGHQFSKLTITFQKVEVLGQEAEACIGEDIAYVGATRVEVDVDPDITKEDPTSEPRGPLPIERPPLASPYL
jgi:hypothetical protein